MTDLKTLIRLYRAWLIALAAVVLAALAFWQFRGYGGRPEVREKIDEISVTAKANERRVDAIIDAAKTKEEEVKKDVSEKIATQSDDALPALLAGLLSEYRKGH